MFRLSSAPNPSHLSKPLAASETAYVRASPGRADRLRAFICGHLRPAVDVEVVLTPTVETVAVLHADIDMLVSSDATDLKRQQAEQLFENVDAEFLVLLTTQPAPLDRIPVNDQLTADHAHQFGDVSMDTTKYGLPERTVEFADAMIDIWDRQGTTTDG